MGNGVEAASLTAKVELKQRTCSFQHTIHRKAVKLVSSCCKMASFTQCFEVETVMKSAIFATDMNTSGVFIREAATTATETKTSLENKHLGNGDYFVIIIYIRPISCNKPVKYNFIFHRVKYKEDRIPFGSFIT